MAVHELKSIEMTQSGESIDFVSGVLLESELDGNKHYDLTLKNVVQYDMFYDYQQKEEPVEVTITTIHDQTGKAQMEVRTVNKRDADDNIIELVTTDAIELS